MGATLTVNDTTTEMIHLVGDILVLEESQRDWYTVPPKGEYTWEISGYAMPFEMAVSEEFGGGTQTKTRLEFTIKGGKGDGKRFTDMFTFSIGPRANLGKLLRKLGVDLSPDPETRQWDLDRIVGYRGKSYVSHGADQTGVVKLDDNGKPRYAKVTLDTVEGVGKPEQAYRFDLDNYVRPEVDPNNPNNIQSDEWPTD